MVYLDLAIQDYLFWVNIVQIVLNTKRFFFLIGIYRRIKATTYRNAPIEFLGNFGGDIDPVPRHLTAASGSPTFEVFHCQEPRDRIGLAMAVPLRL